MFADLLGTHKTTMGELLLLLLHNCTHSCAHAEWYNSKLKKKTGPSTHSAQDGNEL